MGMKFTQVRGDTFQSIQLNAGVLLSTFTPATGTYAKTDIIAATSGGSSFSAVPDYIDFGEDIDNVPANTKELKQLDSVTVTLSGSFVAADTAAAKRLMAHADLDASTGKLTPRSNIEPEDFQSLWWVGDYSDKNGATNGGFIAVEMLNTINTGGFQITSTDKGKGQFAFEFTAHYSLDDIDVVPYNVYIKSGTAEPGQ